MRRRSKRSFLKTWTLPLLGGPAATALMLGLLWLTLTPPDLDSLPGFVADASANGALRPAEDDSKPRAADAAAPVVVAETLAAVRDVTPVGVTPGPAVTGPLKRVKPAPRVTAKASDQPADRYARVVVLDAGHFRAVKGSDALVVSIAGVTAPGFDATCTDEDGQVWRCGAKARAELARLIGGRSVGCTTVDASDPRAPVARCLVGSRDIAAWLVENGWADPDGSLIDLAPLQASAREKKRGRFGSAPMGVIAG